MDLNGPLIALATTIITGLGLGYATLHGARVGFDYIGSRGNPRNRAQAHESGIDLVKGLAILGITIAGTAALATTLAVH